MNLDMKNHDEKTTSAKGICIWRKQKKKKKGQERERWEHAAHCYSQARNNLQKAIPGPGTRCLALCPIQEHSPEYYSWTGNTLRGALPNPGILSRTLLRDWEHAAAPPALPESARPARPAPPRSVPPGPAPLRPDFTAPSRSAPPGPAPPRPSLRPAPLCPAPRRRPPRDVRVLDSTSFKFDSVVVSRYAAAPDADLAGDLETTQSTSGLCLEIRSENEKRCWSLFGRSKRQGSMASSACEAEMITLAIALKADVLPMMELLTRSMLCLMNYANSPMKSALLRKKCEDAHCTMNHCASGPMWDSVKCYTYIRSDSRACLALKLFTETYRIQNPDISRADQVGAHGGVAGRGRAELGANRTVRLGDEPPSYPLKHRRHVA